MTTGLVVEQMERAIRTSPSLRYDSSKLEVLFLISKIGFKIAGAIKSTSSGMWLIVLRAFRMVEEMGDKMSVLRPVINCLPIWIQALGRLLAESCFSFALMATLRSSSVRPSSFMSSLIRSGASGGKVPFLRSALAR